ncbi:MAG: dihydrodipicolinate synthase family protein [Paenibacillaceae bacterium]|nr:dihydrodipicolinate synthase family protein [Paenibacillaceae bacterium]
MTDRERIRHGIQGPISSISTPFDKDGNIDERGLRNCVEYAIAADSGTILLTYGDSLFSVLTDREIGDVTRIVTEQTAGRGLVVGAGNWWTGESIRFAAYCREIGVDVFMPLPPNWAGSCTEDTLIAHFEQIADVMPVMLVTALGPGVGVPLPAIARLLERDNGIVAVKDDICGAYGRKLAGMANGRWSFLSGGRKENHLDVLPYGAEAYLSMYMRFMPSVAHRYWAAVETGAISEAASIVQEVDMPFMAFIAELGMNFDAVIHGAMELAGVAERWRRLPYSSLDDAQMERLAQFLERVKRG